MPNPFLVSRRNILRSAGIGFGHLALTGLLGSIAGDLFLYKGTATSTIVPILPANGETVYATLYSKINGAWQSNAYLYTESGTLTPAALTSPTPGLSTILGTSNVLFQWTAESPASDYQLNLSAIAPGGSDLFLYRGTALSRTVLALPANGVTLYPRGSSRQDGLTLHTSRPVASARLRRLLCDSQQPH